ncbi:MAG: class C sortase [Ruminococcus sp.]|nr:class C sortase [Ruminococcus sp.]
MKKKINKASLFTTIFFTLMLFVGVSVMLYPIISDWWNSKVQSRAVANYEVAVANMDTDRADKMIEKANKYNEKLAKLDSPFVNYDEITGYDSTLNISGTGIMGYISIPVIQVELPIYHGTSEEVLNIAAGHLEGSSLPVGGANTHAVISAHRGLPSARLFTDLDRIEKGDVFTINILDRIYTYEVEEILIVEPHEINTLSIIPNSDYVTLMTCTPYGVNTHRLLIRSHRIETVYKKEYRVVAEMVKIDPMLVIPFVSAPLFLILICVWVFGGKRKPKSPRDIAAQLVAAGREE